jgi:hypothetical protein
MADLVAWTDSAFAASGVFFPFLLVLLAVMMDFFDGIIYG